MNHDVVERGKIGSCEVGNGELEYGSTQQLDEAMASRCRGRSCRQPKAQGRRTHLQRFIADSVSEMMRFIDDEDAEPMTDSIHVPPGTLEGRDRDRPEVPLSVAEDAWFTARELPGRS